MADGIFSSTQVKSTVEGSQKYIRSHEVPALSFFWGGRGRLKFSGLMRKMRENEKHDHTEINVFDIPS